MTARWILFSATVCLFASGCSGRLDYIRYDNPKVRGLQAEQLKKFLPSQTERVRMMKYLAPRVGFLNCGGPDETSVGSGRAAALTRDGYYITASHVIGDDPFALEETSIKKEFQNGVHTLTEKELERIIQTRSYPGRVVWRDEKLDLAIVKFEKRTREYFKSVAGEVVVGTVVYSADDSGLGLIMTDSEGTEKMVGNGPFLVAGKITSVRRSKRLADARMMSTGIVGRGGMSGAPLADRDGTLRGIVLHIDVNYLFPWNMRTVAGMISHQRIQEIIASDRAR